MGQKLSGSEPQQAEDLRGHDMGRQKPPDQRSLDGRDPARIPSRQRETFADDCHTKAENPGLQPCQTARRVQNEGKDRGNGQSCNSVNPVLVF